MILVTGGNGFIGNNLVKLLTKKGYNVLIVDKVTKGNSKHKEIIGNLNDFNFVKTLNGQYEAIFHCAGRASVRDSVVDPLGDFESNVQATINMLEFSRKTKSKTFILLSSVSVFDVDNELPLTELSIKKATSPYGASKLSCEYFCYSYFRTYGLDIRIARLFNTFGPGCNHLFIYDMIKKIKNSNDSVNLLGTGNQLRDYIYIEDLVEAIFLIWSNGIPGEDYNICSGEPISLKSITEKIITILSKPNLKINTENKVETGDIEKWYGKPDKIKKIGFQKKFSIDEGLKLTLNFNNSEN